MQRPKAAPPIAPMARHDNSAAGLSSGQASWNTPPASMADLTRQYKREIGRHVLETLDEESLWQFAHRCLHRGLVRPVIMAGGEIGIKLGTDNGPTVSGNAVVQEGPHLIQNQEIKRPPGVGPVGNSHPSGDQTFKKRYGEVGFGSNGYSGHAGPVLAARDVQKKSVVQTLPKNTIGTNPDEDQPTATTIMLRNLPPDFDQARSEKWIDEQGCAGQYDFLLWFPAKQTSRTPSRLNSYAFVNFRNSEDALRFRKEHTLVQASSPNPDTDDEAQLPLSVAVAKVQGFTQNYLRFRYLLDKSVHTRCAPFFAQDSIDSLSIEELETAPKEETSQHKDEQANDWQLSTVIVRNLPSMVITQEVARSWLDRAGYKGQYDFFLFFPPKRGRKTVQGLGYAFVNFKTSKSAAHFLENLNGVCVVSGEPALKCFDAKVQGLKACMDHFTSRRCRPWVEGIADESGPGDAAGASRIDPFSGHDGLRSFQ